MSDGFVYFIQADEGGPIKIGWSLDAAERLRTLQTASPFRLRVLAEVPGSLKKERELHKQFAAGRIHGEWFSPDTPGLVEIIAQAMNDELQAGIYGWCERCQERPVDPGRDKFCGPECAKREAQRRSRDWKRSKKEESFDVPHGCPEEAHG